MICQKFMNSQKVMIVLLCNQIGTIIPPPDPSVRITSESSNDVRITNENTEEERIS